MKAVRRACGAAALMGASWRWLRWPGLSPFRRKLSIERHPIEYALVWLLYGLAGSGNRARRWNTPPRTWTGSAVLARGSGSCYMSTVANPAWTALGPLPPIDPDLPASPERSPYPVSLKDVVMRFSTTPDRQAIMKGFLGYRVALHKLGYTSGFQWLDGSFMEEVETIEKRAPCDIDVVTFARDPAGDVLSDADMSVLGHDAAKTAFNVDSYIVELDLLPPRELTFWSAYWYSMWSHRRNQAWKGFLQIEMAPTEDAEALSWLSLLDMKGGQS